MSSSQLLGYYEQVDLHDLRWGILEVWQATFAVVLHLVCSAVLTQYSRSVLHSDFLHPPH